MLCRSTVFQLLTRLARSRILTARQGSSAVRLRPYQESCIHSCLDALASGCTRIGVSLPTGSGKTTIFLTLLARLPPLNPKATHSLIIVNSIELARQTAEQARNLLPHLAVEIEQGSRCQATGNADITVATYQTLLRPDRLSKFDPSKLKAIIVDEAHHAAAASYRRILSRFDSDITQVGASLSSSRESTYIRIPIIGFSATFSRHDGLALGAVFERIVYHQDILHMIRDEWLSSVKFTTVRANIDLSDVTVNRGTGDFNASSLAHVVNTGTVNTLVVDAWLDRAATRRSTLVFCANLAHVRDLTSAFRSAGIDARYIYSNTKIADRDTLLAAFRQGEFPVLVNCAVLTEGADIPSIDCIVVARPTKSRNVFSQMLGRGLRLSKETGKTDCYVIDFVENISRVSDVMSLPTLLGLPPDVLEGETRVSDEILVNTDEKPELQDENSVRRDNSHSSQSKIPKPTKIVYLDYDDPFVVTDHASGAPHVSRLSSLAWVGCGEDIYVLDCLTEGFIRVERAPDRSSGHYNAHYTPVLKLRDNTYRGFTRKRKILVADSLSAAICGCDTFARKVVLPDNRSLQLFRTARWRGRAASSAQKDYIAKRFKKYSLLNCSRETPDFSSLTKGQAANIITRLQHGAQGRHTKKMKLEQKRDRLEIQKQEILNRTRVCVGPLRQSDRRSS